MTLAQHFAICGLECSNGLELGETGDFGGGRADITSSSDSFSPLERSYKPRVLRMIPEPWTHFHPDAFCGLVLPQGLRFCTDKQIDRYPARCHSFLLTKEDGEKMHGMAMIFYEEVKDINICHAVHTLQKMYSTEAEGSTLQRLRPPGSSRVTSERSRSLPRHYQQTRLSSSTLDLSSASYDYRQDVLFVTKAICFVMEEPLIEISSEILEEMRNYVCKSDFCLSVLEDLVSNLLFNIPIPNPGTSVRFWCLDRSLTLSMPKVPQELNFFDYNLLDFFDMLGVENAIKLFTCALLEHQILVYSRDFDKLMLVCSSVTALMYPFEWQHVYVPILPPNMENFLDAPVPYIMGLLRRTHDIELAKKGSVCIVDIDNGELDLPEELPEFPNEKELIDEVQNSIAVFGGKDGANVLKEHAKETRDLLEMSTSNNDVFENSNSDTMEELNQMISKFEILSQKAKPMEDLEHMRPRLNNAIREIFVNRFVHMFHSYDHFVIVQNEMDLNSLTPQQVETQQNFDKISFLSDQKKSHLPFLSSFLETQTFSCFIDESILEAEAASARSTSFSIRLTKLKEKFGESLVRTPTYEPCDIIEQTDSLVLKRLKEVVIEENSNYLRSQSINQKQSNYLVNNSESKQQQLISPGIFPLLEPNKLVKRAADKNSRPVFVRGDRSSKSIDPGLHNMSKISLLNSSPAAIAETNWTFVQELLKECKVKTKRILLEKLGQEAVHWGHGNFNFTGSEENVLVASICDLIERIWSHGLQNRSGKSSLWHFLYKFGRANEKVMPFKGLLGKQAFCSPFIKSKPYVLPSKDSSRHVQVSLLTKKKISPVDLTVLSMIHNVSTIKEIKTEIGYARAWVRLALERQSLSKFLGALASDPILLKNLYKRYAFLRSDEEREQAIFHLQTLSTADFSCFTNAYTRSSVLYQVLIFPSPTKNGTTPCSSNVWLQVIGSLTETPIVRIPRGVIHFCFWEKNLGVITSLRLGHDNTGSQPNWLVEHVLMRNEFTGHMYKFACGRWLGASMDDGSTERYMVGYPVSCCEPDSMPVVIQSCARAPKQTLPSTPMKSSDPENEVIELQTMLGDAINRIVKFHLKSLNEKISYAHLMCGEFGLVHALINIFSFGYKSARLFGKNLSIWDFFLKVTMDFNQSLATLHLPPSAQNSPMHSPRRGNTLESPRRNSSLSQLLDSPKRSVEGSTPQGTLSRTNQFRRMYTKLITRIETRCSRLGKDDKFQLFICLAAYDRLLGKIVTDLTRSVAAQHLYEESSFLRCPQHISFLSHILQAIQDISIPVDPAMTRSLE